MAGKWKHLCVIHSNFMWHFLGIGKKGVVMLLCEMVWWWFGSLCEVTVPAQGFSHQLSRNLSIHMKSLVFVGWLMLTTVWSLPLRVVLCLTK